MRGWRLAGLRRRPGPVIGTLVAATTAAVLSVAALGVLTSHTPVALGRLAGADVVVAGQNSITQVTGTGDDQDVESVPLPAYRGVPATLAARLARVPGVAAATGESGFPSGEVGPGLVDLVAVTADPGVTPDVLAAHIKSALHGGAGYTIATGDARSDLADPSVVVQRTEGHDLGIAVLPILLMTALFALAATTALSVSLRRGRFALLRAVGAKRGQIRSAVLVEQVLIAVTGGLLGFLPGTWLAGVGVRALAGHGMLPRGSTAPANPWFLLLSCGILLVVCVLSGLVAARSAARTSPARAVREVNTERRGVHPVRLVLGLVAVGGAITLDVVTQHQSGPGAQLALAAPLLMCGLAAVALLGPLLVTALAALIRPLRRFGPGSRLALAGIGGLPRRTASAMAPVALAIGLIGAIGFSNTTIAHAGQTQSAQAVVADRVLQGDGLNAALLGEARALPGVTAAVGISSLNMVANDPDPDSVGAASVTGGSIDRLLDMNVLAGSLSSLSPGQIAVSSIEGASGEMGVHLGSKVTVYLPDGTPYHATVSAVYQRALALGDLLIPGSVSAGHTGGPATYDQILVDGGAAGLHGLDTLAAAHPGVQVADRQVYNAQVRQHDAENQFGNNLILGVMAVLAAVTMVNTLIVATLERRRQVRLLRRVGATGRQLAAMFAWQALFVTVCGIAAGAAVATGALTSVDRAVTGSAAPYIPFGPAALIVGAVAALATGAVMGAFRLLPRH